MSISLQEQLITLAEASHRLPGRPSSTSIWRWYHKGVRNVRLETLVIAGRRYTSIEALERFCAATTAAAANGTASPVRTSRQREKAIAAAEAELADEGIGRPGKTTQPRE